MELRREIGLFRYTLIRDAAEPGCPKRERGRLVHAIADRQHVGPDGRLVRVSARTLDRVDPRVVMADSKRSFLGLGLFHCARRPGCSGWRSQLKRERPERTTAQVHEIMLRTVGESEQVLALRTCRPISPARGLNVRADGRSPGRSKRRSEAGERNELWTRDGLHGPKLAGSAARQAVLLAFIDRSLPAAGRVAVGHRRGRVPPGGRAALRADVARRAEGDPG